MSIDRVFHNEPAAVSIKPLPYFTVLFLWELLVCRSQIEAVSLGDIEIEAVSLGDTGLLNSVCYTSVH